MFTIWENELDKLGEVIGEGNESVVYSTPDNEYVYKVYKDKSLTMECLKGTVRYLLENKNSIPFQLPIEFVGIVLDDHNRYRPVFKQLKVEPIVGDVELPYEEDISDTKPKNYGIYKGKVVAIDVYRKNYFKTYFEKHYKNVDTN